MQRDPWLADFRGLRGRIGLYGGSFDPVHRGHLEVARSAQRARDLERVVFLPTARNPMKPRGPRASDADRAAMLRLALAAEPDLFVSPLELERAGTSYTVETLEAIRAEVDPAAELTFVMGSDCLPDFPRWHRVRELFGLARLCVVEREGFGPADLEGLVPALGRELVEQLRRDFVARAPIPSSSTASREAARAGRPEDGDLPAAVARYIREHGLYR
ncbi:MAG: nicotinate (nicotinamide) nucleotide adenylyltransferase [Planctomycetes bacterium]|nr:nicotinate (nicotinamide) nucleotide adenylyltransferase [Planctomycetota bacterium]